MKVVDGHGCWHGIPRRLNVCEPVHAIEPMFPRQRLKTRRLEDESPGTGAAVHGTVDRDPIGHFRDETSAVIRHECDVRVFVVLFSERRQEAGDVVPAAANLGHGMEKVESDPHLWLLVERGCWHGVQSVARDGALIGLRDRMHTITVAATSNAGTSVWTKGMS